MPSYLHAHKTVDWVLGAVKMPARPKCLDRPCSGKRVQPTLPGHVAFMTLVSKLTQSLLCSKQKDKSFTCQDILKKPHLVLGRSRKHNDILQCVITYLTKMK